MDYKLPLKMIDDFTQTCILQSLEIDLVNYTKMCRIKLSYLSYPSLVHRIVKCQNILIQGTDFAASARHAAD